MLYQPHEYQRHGEQLIVERDHLALLWEMGLGKSVVTLSAIARLKYDLLAIGKVLVIAPKKVAEGTWTGEARKWDHLSMFASETGGRQRATAYKSASDTGRRVRDRARQRFMAG